MVCKNRKGKKSSTATSATVLDEAGPMTSNSAAEHCAGPSSLGIWNDLNDVDLAVDKPDASSRKRRKTPLLDLNLDDDDHINDQSEPSTSSGTGTVSNKRSKLDIMSALTDVENEVDSNLLKEIEKDLDESRPSSTSTTSSSLVKESSTNNTNSNG